MGCRGLELGCLGSHYLHCQVVMMIAEVQFLFYICYQECLLGYRLTVRMPILLSEHWEFEPLFLKLSLFAGNWIKN